MVFNVTSSNGDGGLVTAKDDGNEHATIIISRVFVINSILKNLSIRITPRTRMVINIHIVARQN